MQTERISAVQHIIQDMVINVPLPISTHHTQKDQVDYQYKNERQKKWKYET